MKRFAAFALTLVLCLGLFSGCGSEANYNVADVASAIEAVAAIDNPTDFTDDDLTLDMSLDMEATVEECGPAHKDERRARRRAGGEGEGRPGRNREGRAGGLPRRACCPVGEL